MFRTIVVEREYGSGAGVIARKLAERLNWKLWDQAFTEELAKAANVTCPDIEQCSEKVDSPLYRLAKVFFRGSFETSISMGDNEPLDSDRVMTYARDVSTKIADEGNGIIVGRGAVYFLRNRRDTFRVFLFAPHAEKLRRLIADGQSAESAEQGIETVDQERRAFVKRYFNKDWPCRPLYHIMINTAMGDDLVIETILNTMHQLEASTDTTEKNTAETPV